MGKLVNRKPFNTTIKNSNWDTMDKLSRVSRIDKTKLTDEALELLFEKYRNSKIID